MWKACEEHLNSSQLGHPCCEASLPATAPPTFFFLIKVKNNKKKKTLQNTRKSCIHLKFHWMHKDFK